MTKRSTPKRSSAPKTGTSIAESAKVQAKHAAIAREALTESRAPSEILKPSQRKALGGK